MTHATKNLALDVDIKGAKTVKHGDKNGRFQCR